MRYFDHQRARRQQRHQLLGAGAVFGIEIGVPLVEQVHTRLGIAGYSSGERQLRSLAEIAGNTQARVYLLDEWDANLDAKNRASAEQLVALLAERALVVEISHRDRA